MFWTQKIARGTGVQYCVNSFHSTLLTFDKGRLPKKTFLLVWIQFDQQRCGIFYEEYIQNHIHTKVQISETMAVSIVKNICPPCISSEEVGHSDQVIRRSKHPILEVDMTK